MKCEEIREKLFTKKSNMDEEQILKEVMTEFTPEKIERLKRKGMTDEEIQKALETEISVSIRRKQKEYMNEIQHDNPRIRNTTNTILNIMDNNYKNNRNSGITEYEVRNVLRQTGQSVELFKNMAHDRWLKTFNGVVDGDSPVDPSKFFRDEKRAQNLVDFFLTKETKGSSVEMQLQSEIKKLVDDFSKEMRVEPQSFIDAALMSKSNLFMQFKRMNGGIPTVRSRLLGERRYAFISSTEESFKFRDWFNRSFEDIVENPKDRDILYDELFGYSKSLMSDFDPKDTTTMGGINKFESLRKRGILNDDVIKRWVELSGIDGEEVLENLHGKTSQLYGVLNTYGSKPLRNANSIKTIAMNAASGAGDIFSEKVLDKTFRDYEGMLKYVLGDRSSIEPNFLLDLTDIVVGMTKMCKSPLMALRQLDDYTVRNFFSKKYSNKSTASTISDTLKYTKRAMFGDDFDNLAVKDKEVILGIGSSMADTLFGHGDSLTRVHQKDGGWIGRGSDFSYTYLSGMAYHERVFERAGMLHTSNIIKDLQKEDFSTIMKIDQNGLSSRGTLRRAISEVGITESEWDLFKKVGFTGEYFSSDEMLDFLKNNRDSVKDLIYLSEKNLDFYSVNKSIEIKINSMLPYEYDVENGFFSAASREKLIDDAEQFFIKRTNVKEFPEIQFARDYLEGIQYLNGDLVFYWKPNAEGLMIGKDAVERDLRLRFKGKREEISKKFAVSEYRKLLSNDKEREKIISNYNKYLDKANERLINKKVDEKIESIYSKFQDLRNNMFQESSVLRYDYWDKYIADKAAGDTKHAAINKMFSFYKSALWKNTERMASIFRDYDANGNLGVKNFFNRYAFADSASYIAMAGLYGMGNMILSGDILSEDKRSDPAGFFQNMAFVGTGLYVTAPMKFVEGLTDTTAGVVTLDDRKFVSGLKQMKRQVMPSTFENYAEALMENYF